MGCQETEAVEQKKILFVKKEEVKKEEIQIKKYEKVIVPLQSKEIIIKEEPKIEIKNEIKTEVKKEVKEEIKTKIEINIQEEPIKEVKKEVKAKKKINVKSKKDKNYVIWIDPNIDSLDNSTELKSKLNSENIKLFKSIYIAVNHLKSIKTKNVIVIINEKAYSEFIKIYKENLVDMCFTLTIILFTKNENEKEVINNNKEIKQYEHIFFQFGGIANKIDKIKSILKQEENKNETEISKNIFDSQVQLTFELIDNKEKLLLPLSFKALIENAINDNMEQYTNSLLNPYSQQNNKIKGLLSTIISLQTISTGLLAKYYAKFYSIESNFYRDLNKSLRLNQAEKYLPFIKTLYDGVKLKSLPLASDNILYRGATITRQEIKAIQENLNNKIENLPGLIVFCKPFLSFSKEREVAENFLSPVNNQNNFVNVLFVLEKDDNVGYNLSTHCDLENVSFYQEEREVLFFPFSSFEIKELKEVEIRGINAYEIKLLYLGKYLKDIENDKNIILKEENIPDSEFKKQLVECGLVKKENIEQMSPKTLIKNFKKYEEEVNKMNIITGEIYIGPEDVNKNIQIINSFENFQRTNNLEVNGNINQKYLNENEIKKNTEIKINGNLIGFSYLYGFETEGKYKIEYSFKTNLTRVNHLFSDCKNINKLDFSNFNSENAENMSYMFYNCISLYNINLTNFKTKNVIDMQSMFNGCESLEELNLSKFNTKNVTNMDHMFNNCKSFIYLDLSNFNTQNVTNMCCMFYNCSNLISLNISNFNIKKVTNMKNILTLCDSLINLKSSFQYH